MRKSTKGVSKKTKTELDYHQLAQEAGLKWIDGALPRNVLVKSKWQCEDGHIFHIRYADIQQGRRCPVCNNHKFKDERDYRELAQSRGIQFRGPVPQNSREPTKWFDPRTQQEFVDTYRRLSNRKSAGRNQRRSWTNIRDSLINP